MKKILFTGYNKDEFLKKSRDDEAMGCYICKRRDGDIGIAEVVDGDGNRIGYQDLSFQLLETVCDGIRLHYLLCHECMILLHCLADKFNNSDTGIEMPSWN